MPDLRPPGGDGAGRATPSGSAALVKGDGGGGRRRGGGALRRQHHRRHRAGQGEDRRPPGRAAAGGADRALLRPLRPDRAGRGHAQARAARGGRRSSPSCTSSSCCTSARSSSSPSRCRSPCSPPSCSCATSGSPRTSCRWPGSRSRSACWWTPPSWSPRTPSGSSRSAGSTRETAARWRATVLEATRLVGPAHLLLDGDHHPGLHAGVRADRARRASSSTRWPSPRPSPWWARRMLSVTLVPVLCTPPDRRPGPRRGGQPGDAPAGVALPARARAGPSRHRVLTLGGRRPGVGRRRRAGARGSERSSCRRSTRAT